MSKFKLGLNSITTRDCVYLILLSDLVEADRRVLDAATSHIYTVDWSCTQLYIQRLRKHGLVKMRMSSRPRARFGIYCITKRGKKIAEFFKAISQFNIPIGLKDFMEYYEKNKEVIIPNRELQPAEW